MTRIEAARSRANGLPEAPAVETTRKDAVPEEHISRIEQARRRANGLPVPAAAPGDTKEAVSRIEAARRRANGGT
jgi:hypothetical protein